MTREKLYYKPCSTCHNDDCVFVGKEDTHEVCEDYQTINALEQEPFINKPCVSNAVCEHDKQKVLDKIRAEIHATAELHEDGDYYLRDEWIDEILDKYKAENNS